MIVLCIPVKNIQATKIFAEKKWLKNLGIKWKSVMVQNFAISNLAVFITKKMLLPTL